MRKISYLAGRLRETGKGNDNVKSVKIFILSQLVAIGKTTAEAMKTKGWHVTAVAEQPNAQALVQCITNSAKEDEAH